MDKQQEKNLNQVKSNGNVELKQTVTPETNTVTEDVKVSLSEKGDDHQDYEQKLRKYDEELKRWQEHVRKLNEEFANLLTKSQDIFEKQLSYISAGALGLSVGFIKEIVDIKQSNYKWMVVVGWGLLIFTLLLNLHSHLIAVSNAKKGKLETENLDLFDDKKINTRTRKMEIINTTTVWTLTGGIFIIVLFITINSIYAR